MEEQSSKLHNSCKSVQDAARTQLYGRQTELSIENLSCSPYKLSHHPELVQALALVKKAAALANERAGVISEELCQRISAVCDQIINGEYDAQFQVDMLHGGGSIAFNQNINEVIGSLAGAHPKEHVNASQSTADSCSTAFRIALLIKSDSLVATLKSIERTLHEKTDTYTNTITIARTCLQDAMPVSISSMFAGWSEALKRRRKRLEQALNQLRQVNLGGTVIGNGAGAPETYRAAVIACLNQVCCSKLSVTLTPRANLYDAAQNCDDIAEVSSALSQLAEVAIKVCSDLRLLSSGPQFGFGEIAIPAVQEGSSFFSNKNNPVVPETTLQACFHVLGNARAVQAVVEHGELNLNVFESGAFFHTVNSIVVLQSALELLLKKCLQDMIVREEKCAEMIRMHKTSGSAVSPDQSPSIQGADEK